MKWIGRALALGAALHLAYAQVAWARAGELLVYREQWLVLAVSLASLACGVALWRRPATRGAALVLLLIAYVPQADSTLAYLAIHGVFDRRQPITPFIWYATWALPAALLVLYPHGTRGRRWRYASAVGFGLVPVVLAVLAARAFVGDPRLGSIYNLPNPWVRAAELWFLLVTVTACVIAIRRYVLAGRAGRRTLGPLLLAGLAWSVGHWVFIAWAQLAPTPSPQYESPGFELIAYDLPPATLLALVAAVGWVELVRPRLGRTRDGVLRLQADAATGIDRARSEVGRALGDTSAELLVVDVGGEVVDVDGRPAPAPAAGQVTTWLERDGERIGAIRHSPVLLVEPNVLKLGAVIGAAAVDNHRLHALTLARLEETRAAAARMLDAADDASDLLVQAVLSGPVTRLDEALRRLDDPDGRIGEVHALLLEALGEVRALSHASPVANGELARSLADLVATRGADVELRVAGTDRYEPAVETTVLLVAAAACNTAEVSGEPILLDVEPFAGGVRVSVGPVRTAPPTELVDRAETLGAQVIAGPTSWRLELPSMTAALVAG